jgi:hypothetical protein
MRWRIAIRATAAPLLLLLLLAGCAPLIADYSLEAYKNATTLKAETLDLIDKSNESYGNRKKDIETLTTKINVAYEFAAGTPYNSLSAQQWQLLRDPNGSLYGAYIALWKRSGTIPSTVFRTRAKTVIGMAFDEIICLEASKQTLQSCYPAAGTSAAGTPAVRTAKTGGQTAKAGQAQKGR